MDRLIEYASEWNKSAKHFYDSGDYKWIVSHLPQNSEVLEIGCGTGYSTLSLLEAGNKVIAVDKNFICINRAIQLVQNKYSKPEDCSFLKADIFERMYFQTIINDFVYNLVVIWNVGTAQEDKSEHDFHTNALRYLGYTEENIHNNYLSSYNESIIYLACQLAKFKNAPIQIVERINHKPDDDEQVFYSELAKAIDYKKIKYDFRNTTTLSGLGKKLTCGGKEIKDDSINIILMSVIIEP